MDEGSFYLVAAPWRWTFVGRFVRYINFRQCVMDDVIYFTYTGATFDILCTKGLVVTGDRASKYHRLPNGSIIAHDAPLIAPWLAKTPWVAK